MKTLSGAQVNHLRRLLGWVSCEIGQSAEELVATVGEILPAIGEPDDAAKQRLVESHAKSAAVPAYVRQAVKQLSVVLREIDGDIVDGEVSGSSLPNKQVKIPRVEMDY